MYISLNFKLSTSYQHNHLIWLILFVLTCSGIIIITIYVLGIIQCNTFSQSNSLTTKIISYSYFFYQITAHLVVNYVSIKKYLKIFMWNHFSNNFNSSHIHTFHFICPCSSCLNLPPFIDFSYLNNCL